MFPNTVAVIVFSLKEADLRRNLPAYPLTPRPGDMEDFAMRSWSEAAIILGLMAAVVAALAVVAPTMAQAPSAPRVARMADGEPNLNGVWEANNTANWGTQGHQARQGPILVLGAAFSIPGGLGVVEGNDIPYRR
jgi:hypothetical protein